MHRKGITILNSLARWQSVQSPGAQRDSWAAHQGESQEPAADVSPPSPADYQPPQSSLHGAKSPFTLQEETVFSKSYKMTKGSPTKRKPSLWGLHRLQECLLRHHFLKDGQWTELSSVIEGKDLLWGRIVELVLPGSAEASLHATISP